MVILRRAMQLYLSYKKCLICTEHCNCTHFFTLRANYANCQILDFVFVFSAIENYILMSSYIFFELCPNYLDQQSTFRNIQMYDRKKLTLLIEMD